MNLQRWIWNIKISRRFPWLFRLVLARWWSPSARLLCTLGSIWSEGAGGSACRSWNGSPRSPFLSLVVGIRWSSRGPLGSTRMITSSNPLISWEPSWLSSWTCFRCFGSSGGPACGHQSNGFFSWPAGQEWWTLLLEAWWPRFGRSDGWWACLWLAGTSRKCWTPNDHSSRESALLGIRRLLWGWTYCPPTPFLFWSHLATFPAIPLRSSRVEWPRCKLARISQA